MKAGVVIIVLLGVVAICVTYFTGASIEKNFDPDEQGRQAQGAAETEKTWLAVVDAVGEPKFWREGSNEFDFGTPTFWTKWDDGTRTDLEARIGRGDMRGGFSLLYQYTAKYTFALNFDSQGNVLNIQDKESKSDLLDEGE